MNIHLGKNPHCLLLTEQVEAPGGFSGSGRVASLLKPRQNVTSQKGMQPLEVRRAPGEVGRCPHCSRSQGSLDHCSPSRGIGYAVRC